MSSPEDEKPITERSIPQILTFLRGERVTDQLIGYVIKADDEPDRLSKLASGDAEANEHEDSSLRFLAAATNYFVVHELNPFNRDAVMIGAQRQFDDRSAYAVLRDGEGDKVVAALPTMGIQGA